METEMPDAELIEALENLSLWEHGLIKHNPVAFCSVDGCDRPLRKSMGVKVRTGLSVNYCNAHRLILQKGHSINRTCRMCKEEYVYVSQEMNGKNHCSSCHKIEQWIKCKKGAYNNHQLTSFMYIEIYEFQDGRCKLCNYKPEFEPEKFKKLQLNLDHDHRCCPPREDRRTQSCGKCIRALLCHPCNLMVGYYERCKGDLVIPEFDKYLATPHFIFS